MTKLTTQLKWHSALSANLPSRSCHLWTYGFVENFARTPAAGWGWGWEAGEFPAHFLSPKEWCVWGRASEQTQELVFFSAPPPCHEGEQTKLCTCKGITL